MIHFAVFVCRRENKIYIYIEREGEREMRKVAFCPCQDLLDTLNCHITNFEPKECSNQIVFSLFLFSSLIILLLGSATTSTFGKIENKIHFIYSYFGIFRDIFNTIQSRIFGPILKAKFSYASLWHGKIENLHFHCRRR
jgi:hypothetical protein